MVSITQHLEENIVNPVDGEASPVASPVAFHLRDLHAVAIVALEVIKIRGINILMKCWKYVFLRKTWRSHLVVGEEGIVVLIDAKVDDVSPVKIYLRILLNEEPDMEAETLPPLLANIPAGLATSVLNIKHFPFEPKLWNHLNNTNHPDDHLAKLFQILVVTLIQETELRCFRALRANASKI